MEEQFNFLNINFDFLDTSTPIVKSNANPISTNCPQTGAPQVLDVETLANKIASVNDLVLQLKTEKEEHAKLQKQMQDLSTSAMSIRNLYEQEKTEKAKYAILSQEFKEKYELAESQLANKIFHFEQLSSKIEQSTEKGPVSYNELTLRYHRLALYLDEEKQLNQKEKPKFQQIQDYMKSKSLTPLPPFKKKKRQISQSKPEQRDQGTQYSPEMISKNTFTDIEVINKKLISQGTQYTWYTTTRGTNTENQNARKELKTQGTQYISSTTTRSTSTSGFIKTHSVGTNFPDESTKLVDDILSEMIYDITPLSPLADEELLPAEQIEMKTVGTMTGLKNVRKAIDYVASVHLKSSDSRPPSRNMYERVKNEVPFMGAPSMNSFAELGASPSSMPNNVIELWSLLGHTFVSLLQNVNTFNSSMNLNVVNDRMRNMYSNDDQRRNNGGDSNFEGVYFEGTCPNDGSPRGFTATTRSTATSPIAEIENQTVQEQRFCNEVCINTTISCPKVRIPNNMETIDSANTCPTVEIQKIILNKAFHGETTAADLSQQINTNKPAKGSKKRCKACKKIKANEAKEQSETAQLALKTSRSGVVNESIQTRTVATQFNNSYLTGDNCVHSEEYRSLSLDSLENQVPEAIQEKMNFTNLEKDLFGISDDELSPSDASSSDILSVAESMSNNAANEFEKKSETDVFCKPFMPKKRKQSSIDTRMFHIKELKAAQQLPVENSYDENSSKKKVKRKRSAMKPLNKFSKVRICSKSDFSNSSLSTGMLSNVTSCDDNYDFPTSVTEQNLLPSDTAFSSSHHTKSMVLETTTTELSKPNNVQLSSPFVHGKSSEAVLNEIQSEEEELKIVFREDSSLTQMRKLPSEGDILNHKSMEMAPIVEQSVSPYFKVISVIDASSNKPPALKSDKLFDEVVCSAGNDGGKPVQNRIESSKASLPPQISELKMLPLVGGRLPKLQSTNGSCSTYNSIEKSSVILENEISVSSIPETGEEMTVLHQPSPQRSSGCKTDASDESSNQRLQVDPCVSELKWAMPVSYSNQTSNSKNSFENLLLDENHERFQEIVHQICDEFATPERPVSAIPPCENSEAENSFSEESNSSMSSTSVKERTKRKRGCLTGLAVKRSERLKAKNSIQEAIKYSSLKIPTVELGKYTKRNTELKSVCEEVGHPSPKQTDHKEVPSSECRLGFFKDLLNKETRVEENSLGAQRNQIKLPAQSSTLSSEEDTSNDLIIDLENEINTIQASSYTEKRKNTSMEVLSTESAAPFNFDESPSSPPPSDREPEADHIPLQVNERDHKHPKTNSLLSQIIANYNHEYHKRILQSRKELDRAVIKQLHTTLTGFANAPCDGEGILRVVEKMCCITNSEQLITQGLISVVKTAPRPEAETPTPVPELYLSQILCKFISLLDPLYKKFPNLRNTLLTNIEKSIFSFTKDFIPLDVTLNLTQFYLAVIADVDSPSNPARLFICKCLFFYTKKAIPMIYETLCVYPSVLPHRDDQTYDRSDALISTIQCILMSTYYDTEKCDLKAKQMLYKLRNFYNYESLKPSREEVIENLLAKLRAGRFKNVSYSFAILGKRTKQNDIEKTVLGERLLSLANEYYQTISESSENDQRIACVLECISFIIKPFPVETDITTYINLYSRFLYATDRQVVQEAALAAILRTIRFGYVRCFRTIYNFQPKYELSDETKVMLRSFVYKKGVEYLKKLENQMQMLTQ